MDQQLKARLIGAVVLVLLAVALVPELLSGRKQHAAETAANSARGTRTYTIDLGGAVTEGARLPAPAAQVTKPGPALAEDANPPEPEPAVPVATGAGSGSEDAIASKPPAALPVAAPPSPASDAKAAAPRTATVEPVAARSGWSVQVGAFGSDATARKLVTELKRDGFAAYVAPLNRSGKTLHRVRVGPEPNRADADRLAVRLKGRGLPASVVAADG